MGVMGPRFLEGDCWERGGALKNKLKSEIFHDKKSLETKMFFSVTTKNSNWEILTKSLVTFER